MAIEETLSFRTKASYAMGHVINDMGASLWFTYVLLYYHKVLDFKNNYAGLVILVGQTSDALATIFVMVMSDRIATISIFSKYGKRKSWHLIGTLCSLVSLPFIFLPCQGCQASPDWLQLLYYCSFAALFMFGWACIQISHLALIPEITHSQNERTGLTAIRYATKVVSNITVYLVAWAFLGVGHSSQEITHADQDRFRNIMLVVMGLGSVTSLAFHLSLREETTNKLVSAESESFGSCQKDRPVPMTTRNWLLEPQFYQVAGTYISARLFVNLSQAYVPLYVQVSLQLRATHVAIIPLVMFTAGFIISLLMKTINRKAGRKLTYLLGSGLGLASAVCVYYGNGETYNSYGIFVSAVMFGMAGTTLIIASLSLAAELIAQNTESSAFVYGAMSFADKILNGVAIMVIQHLVPEFKDCEDCSWYFRDILFYVTGAVAALGALFILTLAPVTVGDRWTDRKEVAKGEGTNERTPLLT